jgi:hypothetical protein
VAKEDPKLLKQAPHSTSAGRIDQTTAARSPILSWHSLFTS